MKHLKSSFHDLHRLFEQSITVRDIAEPLTCPTMITVQKARFFMDKNGFDVLEVAGMASLELCARDSLEEGKVGDYSHELGSNDILPKVNLS